MSEKSSTFAPAFRLNFNPNGHRDSIQFCIRMAIGTHLSLYPNGHRDSNSEAFEDRRAEAPSAPNDDEVVGQCARLPNAKAQVAELVDALVSNTNGKPCRFDPGPGYITFGAYFSIRT